jgi:hypothetical protein
VTTDVVVAAMTAMFNRNREFMDLWMSKQERFVDEFTTKAHEEIQLLMKREATKRERIEAMAVCGWALAAVSLCLFLVKCFV